MRATYTMKIAGLERELPLCSVSDSLDIAAFIMFSDVEITIATAKALLEKCGDFDIILTAETKGIPLAYEMARQSGKNYIVARKSVKVYMPNPISVNVKSITTEGVQTLYLSQEDAARIAGKRVLIADDVISTGGSMKALQTLAEKAGAKVIGQAAILAEGDAKNRDDIIFLEDLPLFKAE